MKIQIPKNYCEGCRNRDEMNRVLAEQIDKQDEQIQKLKKLLSPKLTKGNLIGQFDIRKVK